MLTDVTFISLLLLLLFPLGERCCCCDGATVTWGQVNRYASTLHAQDVYLAADAKANYRDVVYGLTVSTVVGGIRGNDINLFIAAREHCRGIYDNSSARLRYDGGAGRSWW